MPTSAQHLHIRHRRVEVLRVSPYLRWPLPSDSLLSSFFFFRLSLLLLSSRLLVGGLCVPLVGSLAFLPLMEGSEVCGGLRYGMETMLGRMVMWVKVIGLGEQAEQ